ncbi:MAG: UDP-N-acetylmuramoyl-tripeptide--D-alanyl-D-alanine ligase [Patescibacteria group bacterium]
MKQIITNIITWLAKRTLQKYDPIVVGITGSVGKTSTKEAVKIILEKKYSVRATEKSYNNEIGMPLTILGFHSPGKNPFGWLKVIVKSSIAILVPRPYPEVLVLEMGADHPGDIGGLVSFAPCDIGVVTAIAPVHTEYFNSVNAILQEKRKILTHIAPHGFAIFNQDDARLAEQKTSDIKAGIKRYGFDADSDVHAFDVKYKYIETENGIKLEGIQGKLGYMDSSVPFYIPDALAMHTVYSVLAAVTVGVALDMNLVDIAERIPLYQTPPGRLRLIDGQENTTIIDDSYNSSPEAAKAALSVLKDFPKADKGRTFAVLGDMRELGSLSEEAHREIGHLVAELDIDFLITFGPESEVLHAAALEAGMSENSVLHADSHDVIVDFIHQHWQAGDVLLIKGSQNTIRLERVVKRLMQEPQRAAELLVRQGGEWL